ncbi:beta-lactamase-like protein [Xylaria cf. heliscus]|nr:beta-lactamase-like protein [Xylaria cf. heliscus]
MANPPDLHIPHSTSTVKVSIINTGTTITGLKTGLFVEPDILGHEYLSAPCFSFLIQHPIQNRTLVFDLGIRKDWENWPEPLYEYIRGLGATPVVPKEVHEFLDENGVDTKSIEGVVWSHSHFDHVGGVSAFEPHTKIIVGTGTKERYFPGYPTKQEASFYESDVAGHDVEEIDFGRSSLRIGGLSAVDYFADGSFYLLDTPGHYIGHMCGLARVTSNPDSFILMVGDAIHQGGELRPHPWHPLPEHIQPNPFSPTSHAPCDGETFDKLLPNGREVPFYHPSQKPDSVHFDVHQMAETIKQLQKFDAHDNILLIPAHDVSFLDVADFFPHTANTFMEKGWVEKTKWAWLAEFAKAVGQDENIPRKSFGESRPFGNQIS